MADLGQSARVPESDRRVHACFGREEIARYDKGGKWWIEGPSWRDPIPVDEAAQIAEAWERDGGEVFFGLPGGTAFDRKVRKQARR